VSSLRVERDRVVQYGAGLAVGVAAVLYFLPLATIGGAGGMFVYPRGDLPMHLAGHIAFQAPGWHWPLLRAPSLAWPHGESIAMTDSNPILSLIAKVFAGLVGHPVNLFGVWLAGCFILQAVAAVYALRGFLAAAPAGPVNAAIACIAMAALSILMPEYLFRVIHINLMGQFVLLASLGLAARRCVAKAPPAGGTMFALFVLAVLIHPYLFLFCVATLAAPLVGMMVRRDAGRRDAARTLGLGFLAAVGVFVVLSGEVGQGGPGFGLYSMNLLSPFWPQQSGLFGADLPILDETGYQFEGFDYLGAGVLLLLAAACGMLVISGGEAQRAMWRRWAGLVIVLVALFCLAVTPQVTLGRFVLVPLQSRWLEQMFGVVRASGRAIWVVNYAAIAAALGLLAAGLRPRVFVLLTVIAVGLQWADAGPLRASARAYFAGVGQAPPAFAIPPGTRLFRAVPLCGPEDVVATEYRLAALRVGARLADMRLDHAPVDAVCTRALTDGLESPMIAGEVRLFMPSVQALVETQRLGAGVTCEAARAGTLCVQAK